MKNKTSLEWISDLALRLATIAHDPDSWESYKAVETDTKSIVIDRTENNLSRYVRECETHFSALYDADYQQDIENAGLQARAEAAEQEVRTILSSLKHNCKDDFVVVMDGAIDWDRTIAEFVSFVKLPLSDERDSENRQKRQMHGAWILTLEQLAEALGFASIEGQSAGDLIDHVKQLKAKNDALQAKRPRVFPDEVFMPDDYISGNE